MSKLNRYEYEEVLRKAMAAAPIERPEDLVESIVKQCQNSYAKTRKINTLEEQVAKLQEEVEKLQKLHDGLQKEQERQTNRIKKLKNTTAL
jgi:peptidoglycan hydrolase CwlO-like protein